MGRGTASALPISHSLCDQMDDLQLEGSTDELLYLQITGEETMQPFQRSLFTVMSTEDLEVNGLAQIDKSMNIRCSFYFENSEICYRYTNHIDTSVALRWKDILIL
jgi:hypothetical protein